MLRTFRGVEKAEYYRWIATTLPPSELAAAAWRKARRGAVRAIRRWMPQPGLPPPASFGVVNAHELAVRLRGLRAARGPLEPNELPDARALVADTLPSLAGATCANADRILGGEFWLFGEWRLHEGGELAGGIAAADWARDPLHGRRFPLVSSASIDRDAVGTDVRAAWEVGRLAHVTWLAQAHVLAGLPGTEVARAAANPGLYARAALLHLRDFIATQPVGLGIHWTCAMEAALRLIQLVQATLLLRASDEVDDLAWSELAQSIRDHARFISTELEDTQAVPGNHLLADLAGLAVAALAWSELAGAGRGRAWALAAFGRELLRQTREDGFAFESSLPYHRFATELGLVVQAYARRQGLSLAAEPLERLWLMVDVVRGATLGDGLLPNLGDNDSSHAYRSRPLSPLEGWPVVALATALGGPGSAPVLAPESLWLGGLAGLRRNARLVSGQAERRTFAAGGLAVLHGPQGSSASLWAGDNGQHGLGGHAHDDKLATEVTLSGRRVVIDPGCPTYLADHDERNRYRSTSVHPTAVIDEQEQAPIPTGRLFVLPDRAAARLVEVGPRVARAEHEGYLRLSPPILHRRELALSRGLPAVVVTDRFTGEGVHRVEVHWPITLASARLREATPAEWAVLKALELQPEGEGRFDPTRVLELPFPDGLVGIVAFACEAPFELGLASSTWSPGYGERRLGASVRAVMRVRAPHVFTTAFIDLKAIAIV